MTKVSFDNTEVAFKHKTNAELKQAKWLFWLFNYKALVRYGPDLTGFGLRLGLPIKGLVKKTIFKLFCGGETIGECNEAAEALIKNGVGSILDYSVEGVEDEATFKETVNEIKRAIVAAAEEKKYQFAVFKCSGIGKFTILEKASDNELSPKEVIEFNAIKSKLNEIAQTAVENNVRILIDAEESWIQPIIDEMVLELMEKHNRGKVLIYNTLQMYRVDRLEYLKSTIDAAREKGYQLGYKLVRGAYMEKERNRAEEKGYPSPIQPDKESTDNDFNASVTVCFKNRDIVATCLGTHNEESSILLTDLMDKENVSLSDTRFWFAQLYGMSDNISFNLANSGYNVAKYLPYGPVSAVLPYLGRRAQENSSVSGQVGREMSLIVKELKRRKEN